MRAFLTSRVTWCGLIAGAIAGALLQLSVVAAPVAPAVAIVSPQPNQTVVGAVTFYARADAPGGASLQFLIDGQPYGSLITVGACSAAVDTTTLQDGAHIATARLTAQDLTQSTSPPVAFLVANGPAPTPTPTPTPTPNPQQLAAVTVTPSTVTEGQTAQAVARDGAGAALSGATWQVGNTAVAVIDATGLITQTRAGQTDVMATLGGITRETPLTVTPTQTPNPTPTPTPTPTPGPLPQVDISTASQVAFAVALTNALAPSFAGLAGLVSAIPVTPATDVTTIVAAIQGLAASASVDSNRIFQQNTSILAALQALQPAPPAPIPAICTTTPLVVVGIRWPGSQTGRVAPGWDSANFSIVEGGFKWLPTLRFIAVDSRGCTTTVLRVIK